MKLLLTLVIAISIYADEPRDMCKLYDAKFKEYAMAYLKQGPSKAEHNRVAVKYYNAQRIKHNCK